ncbi:unnamed protein product [Ascophyllum nodosum]
MSFVRNVRMRVPAGTAKPGPAIGQALGPLGINMMDFCKKFNEETKHIVPNIPIPCLLSAYSDRSFTFELSSPQTTWFLKRAAGIEKGASRPGHESGGKVGLKALYEIAKIKNAETHSVLLPLESVCRSVRATALSMGLEIVDDREPLNKAQDS